MVFKEFRNREKTAFYEKSDGFNTFSIARLQRFLKLSVAPRGPMEATKVAQEDQANCDSDDKIETEVCIWESENLEQPLLRDQWRRKLDFLIACMGFSIGLGNVWRFPYLCYKNGGGAFLIPYFISVFMAGIPLFLLEVTMGQFMSRGAIAAWDLCPIFRGLGCASTLINFMVNCYYTVILSWGLHYLFASFTWVLPWTKCDQWWNTANCRTYQSGANASEPVANVSVPNANVLASDPATEYWENRVLGLSPGIEDAGNIRWELALCLLLAWLIIFLCICKGIKTSGKVMYVTATSPYLFMIILLIRTALLDGAQEGIIYYLKPDWSRLADMTVWSDAGTQIFFSYALSLGALTALGSYNTFYHNSIRDCCLFAAANTLTSFMAGFVIFATLGYMAHTSKVPISLVAESGPGLAFVIYPKALGTMPASPIWSVCFFLMLLLLGVDSMFGGVEGFVAALVDFFPRIHSNTRLRCTVVGVVCLVSYIVGLTMVTNGGMYVFQLFDYYSGSRIIVIVGFLESVAIGYFYGARRFTNHMRCMYGIALGIIPTLFWCVLTPIFTVLLFVFSAIIYEELTYRRAGQLIPYQFPSWSVKLGWFLASSSLFLIPITMIVQVLRTPGSLCQRLRFLLQPQLPESVVQKLEDYKRTLRNNHKSSSRSSRPNSDGNSLQVTDVVDALKTSAQTSSVL
ncbi:sodium- and chloride-dependent GABA transporter 2 [Clonorchis sinensis]|uniref:Transporter n=1 Tax=Clonorchis sinensis TaxID=79923 RepID=G7YI27_CLOSI|nr:sodium- and chloride-dependent GABA transporter 2 [Clonorchis sinensis]